MKKFIALLLVCLMTLSFVACDKGKNVDNGNSSQAENIYGKFPKGLSAEKIGSIDNKEIYSVEDGGLIYKDDSGKYGTMTLDAKEDSGAKYTYCKKFGDYFQVSTYETTSIDDVTTLNTVGVVDATGKEIIPLKYASVSEINERYVRVCEATEQTADKDEALVYYETDNTFSIYPSDDATHFKGKWYVYDMVAEKMLEGVSGTNKYKIYGYGNFIEYVTDGGEKVIINDKGEKLPDNAENPFDNGYYCVEQENIGSVYNSDHEKLFDYDLDGFTPYRAEDKYFVATKNDNDELKYVLMDTTGKVVSAEFTDSPNLYGNLVHAEDKIYDLEGNIVIEGTFTDVYFDEQCRNAWFLKNDPNYTLIKEDGTILFQGTESDSQNISVYDFSITKTVNDKNMCYVFADNDFTLEGSRFAPWLIKTKNTYDSYDIVDSISGETIISDYEEYDSVSVSGKMIYVYAANTEGGIDIYDVH